MPNWCENNLTVYGPKEDIKQFIKKAKRKDTELSLKKLYPIPVGLRYTVSGSDEAKIPKTNSEIEKEIELKKLEQREKKLKEKYGATDWYDWCVRNWGTKWDVKAELIEIDNNSIEYYFDSAWSPPIEAIKKISRNYPELEFTLEYNEPGMGFKGKFVTKNGYTLENKSSDYTEEEND
jgi:hypothetical protein